MKQPLIFSAFCAFMISPIALSNWDLWMAAKLDDWNEFTRLLQQSEDSEKDLDFRPFAGGPSVREMMRKMSHLDPRACAARMGISI